MLRVSPALSLKEIGYVKDASAFPTYSADSVTTETGLSLPEDRPMSFQLRLCLGNQPFNHLANRGVRDLHAYLHTLLEPITGQFDIAPLSFKVSQGLVNIGLVKMVVQ